MKKQNDTGAIIALTAAIREQANALILSSLSERGVTDILPAHGAVLNALFKHNPMKMNELAEHIGRKKNTVTGLIATLEDRGYCRRHSDPHDARAQLVFLTEKGQAMRHVQEEVSIELLQKIWTGIDAQKQIECVQCLETILHNLTHNNQ